MPIIANNYNNNNYNNEKIFFIAIFQIRYPLSILSNISIKDNIIIRKYFSSWNFKFSQSQKIPTRKRKVFPPPPSSNFFACSLINSRPPFIERRDHGNSHFKRELCTLENPGVRGCARRRLIGRPIWKLNAPFGGNGNFLPFRVHSIPPRPALRFHARPLHPRGRVAHPPPPSLHFHQSALTCK